MSTEKPITGRIEKIFSKARPISDVDRLAQEFPYEIPNRHILVGRLLELGVTDSLEDWSYIKKLDPSTPKEDVESYSLEFYSWNPRLVKDSNRWLIQAVGSQHLFGIDALKIGLDNAIHFENKSLRMEDKYLLPYIHFGKPAFGNPNVEEFQKKHSICSVEFILFNREQIGDLKNLVDSILTQDKT